MKKLKDGEKLKKFEEEKWEAFNLNFGKGKLKNIQDKINSRRQKFRNLQD